MKRLWRRLSEAYSWKPCDLRVRFGGVGESYTIKDRRFSHHADQHRTTNEPEFKVQ